MFGRDYITNTCIALFINDCKRDNYTEQKDFEIKIMSYIALGIEFISHNTAHIPAQMGGDPKSLASFMDYIRDDNGRVDMSVDDIVDDVLDGCGFLGG